MSITEVAQVEPAPADRYAQEVAAGMARYWEVCQEAEANRRRAEAAELENERLRIALAGAREAERAHVQCVVDEAKIAQHTAEIENSMLRDEIASLRNDLSAAGRRTEDARAEVARLAAAMTMLGATILETLRLTPAAKPAGDGRGDFGMDQHLTEARALAARH